MERFDFALSWDGRGRERFLHWVKRECDLKGLKLLQVDSRNVSRVIKGLEKGKLAISFLLDCEADYYDKDDIFARLCYAVKDCHGYVVCDPDDARQASNKSITHYDLVKAHIPVPYTVVVRNWEPDNFRLTKDEIKKLGIPFIIKPASGFGQKGVVKDARGSITEIAKARHFNRGDNFLLQEKINPLYFGEREAWFRVYFLFGEIIPCWWSTQNGWYSHVSLRQMYNHRLLPLARITSEIARITNMDFFSSEIAITGKGNERRFVAIDYVNDQPELNVRSLKDRQGSKGFVPGPVAEVVEHIADRITEVARRLRERLSFGTHRSIWLDKAPTEDESI
ncbi:RimK family alpha-L-glutamate ligase [Candidatus Omnitrophota bacterium]